MFESFMAALKKYAGPNWVCECTHKAWCDKKWYLVERQQEMFIFCSKSAIKITKVYQMSGLIFASGISLHLRVTNQANSMKPLFESVNEKFDNYFRTYLSILTVIDQM